MVTGIAQVIARVSNTFIVDIGLDSGASLPNLGSRSLTLRFLNQLFLLCCFSEYYFIVFLFDFAVFDTEYLHDSKIICTQVVSYWTR